jgi:hypothetical protein
MMLPVTLRSFAPHAARAAVSKTPAGDAGDLVLADDVGVYIGSLVPRKYK